MTVGTTTYTTVLANGATQQVVVVVVGQNHSEAWAAITPYWKAAR